MEIDEIVKSLRGMSWDDYDLQKDITVDKYHLDVEAEKMPMLVAKWGMLLNRASKLRDKAKERLSIVEAELYERSEKEKEGKTTDAAIKSWIKSHPERIKASSEYIEADSHYNYLWSAVKSLDVKREAISEQSRLWAKQYFSRPTISEEAQRNSASIEREKSMEETSNILSERLTDKRKGKSPKTLRRKI